MVEDVHFEAALIGGQALDLIEKLLIAKLSERSSSSHLLFATAVAVFNL